MASYSATAGQDGNGKQEDLCPACGGVGMVMTMTCEICKGDGLVRREIYYNLMNERHRRIMNRNEKRGMTWPIYYTNFYPDFWGPPALVERALHYRENWRKCEESERQKPNTARKSPMPRLPSWETAENEIMWTAPQLDPDRDCCPCCGAKKVPRSPNVDIQEIFDEFDDMPELEQDEIQLPKPQKDVVNLEDREPAPYGSVNLGLVTCFGRGRGAEMYLERKQKEFGQGIGRGRGRGLGRGRVASVVDREEKKEEEAVGGDNTFELDNLTLPGARLLVNDPELREILARGIQLNYIEEYILKRMILKKKNAITKD